MRAHPLGVLPEGNAYLVNPEVAEASQRARDEGLGTFSVLPDALLMRVLSGGDLDDGVGPNELANLQCTSHIFRAFAQHEDLWKAHVLHRDGGGFTFHGNTWRETYGCGKTKDDDKTSAVGKRKRDVGAIKSAPTLPQTKPNPQKPPPIFSDALYLRHLATHRPLDPSWLEKETIPRMNGESVDDDEKNNLQKNHFIETFEKNNEPVILTGGCKHWPCVSEKLWEFVKLIQNVPNDKTFSVGGYQMSLNNWRRYCEKSAREDEELNENKSEDKSKESNVGPIDDAPLYLFDKRFMETCPEVFGTSAWTPPSIINDGLEDDLFSLLGQHDRPDHKWLIHGPERSGSSFHVDPNGTSAWNAVISGKKRWILFKPEVNKPPPGVHPSADGSVVAQPVTLVEWYASFYEHAYEEDEEEESDDDESPDDETLGNPKGNPKGNPNSSGYTVLEGTCNPGDVLFVPSGWWHAALNLEETTAVTQNFCSRGTLPRVLRFLRNASELGEGVGCELVSGTSRDSRGSLFEKFVNVLKLKRPEVLESFEVRRILGGEDDGNDVTEKSKKNSRDTPCVDTSSLKQAHVQADANGVRKNNENGVGLAALFSKTNGDEKNQSQNNDKRGFTFGF